MRILNSGRVQKTPQTGITSDRYQFIGLDQVEPDLGDPLVGPSSIGAKPYTGSLDNLYVLVSDNTTSGQRYWSTRANILAGGIVNPGSITVRNRGVIISSANQVTDVNFVGNGVTVVSTGSSSVDVSITVTDLAVTGSTGSVPYKASTGYLVGSSDLIYSPTNNFVGIGSTIPTAKLDVLGNAKISGILTVGVLSATAGYFSTGLSVGNFKISDNTTFVSVVSGSVGIGTSVPTATLEVVGTAKVSGATTVGFLSASTAFIGILTSNSITSGFITATNIFVSGTSTVGFLTTNNGFIGILTSNSINSGIVSTINLFVSAGATFAAGIQIDTNTLVVNATTDSVGIGTTNPLQKLQIGVANSSGISTDGRVFVVTGVGSVGIGTTSPVYALDVRGNVGFSSFIFLNGSSGTLGQVLLSGGTGTPTWGSPANITAGTASSIAIQDTQVSGLYYPTFIQETTNFGSIRLDTNGLVFNPGLNYLGIGTTALVATLSIGGTGAGINVSGFATITGNLQVNTSSLLVNSSLDRVGVGTTTLTSKLTVNGDISALTSVSVGTTILIGSSANQISTGIITTTTTSAATLDSFPYSTYRSSRYSIQVSCEGQLVGSVSSASTISVSGLTTGSNYASGTYLSIPLTTISGTGNDAYADISVAPKDILTLLYTQNGLFYTNESTSSLSVNTPILLSSELAPSAANQSKLTTISITNPGSGYTTIPSIGIATPTNNPAISGVSGIGSTATAVVTTMLVSNVVINSGGISTTVPTITFSAPIVGTAASGKVGYGVSTISIVSSGNSYYSLPVISFAGTNTSSATAGVSSVIITNIRTNRTGLGYTIGNYPAITISPPTSGVSAAASVTSLSISDSFTINPGVGYTTPPTLTVSSPNIGLNTATITASLGVSTITVLNPGIGYTASPTINLAPGVTGFSARVGLGVTSTGLTFSGGSGYTVGTYTTDLVSVGGFGTGAVGIVTIGAGSGIIGVVISNSGYGYTTIPLLILPPEVGGGSGAGVTITQMTVTDVTILNTGTGVVNLPSVSIIPQNSIGSGSTAIASLGIGTISVAGFGSGYTLPPSVTVTPIGGVGAGASVIAGLGVTANNIVITNPGSGYTTIPTISFSSPVSVASSTTGSVGVGITAVLVTSPGFGYSDTFPTVSFAATDSSGVSAAASVSSVVVTNVFVLSGGIGYTSGNLATQTAIFSPVGTSSTVGYGISTITVTNTGIGYTTASSAVIAFSSPQLGGGVTAIASANLGYVSILPGPGYGDTTRIYFINSIPSSNSIGISTGVGVGTITLTSVGDASYSSVYIYSGGYISNVSIVSPGSGYTTTSKLSATNFDGANVGTGFSFTSGTVVRNYQMSDVMVLNNVGSYSTTPDIIEYGSIANNEILGSFSSDISGTNVRLLFTPNYRDNSIKIVRNLITI
jgi:hypothetical protein